MDDGIPHSVRTNNKNRRSPTAIGDIVLLSEDSKKRQNWRLAKVFPGKDGNVRIIRVFSGGKEFLQSMQKVVPLEISISNQ